MSIPETREIYISNRRERKRVEELMHDCGLRLDDVDRYFGVFDSEENLLAGAGLKGDVIKCVAVRRSARDMSIANTLVSCLV